MKAEELNSDDLKRWADEKVREKHLPLPAAPKDTGPEFEVPDDPSTLTNPHLGQLMLRMSGYYAYTQRLIGIAASELVLVEAEFKLKVNIKDQDIRKELGRINQEAVEAAVLRDDEELTPLYERRLKLSAVKEQLESRLLIYEKLGYALSRELSRREMEARLA